MVLVSIDKMQIQNVCKNGYIISMSNRRYAIHYNVTLAVVIQRTLYLDKWYLDNCSLTKSDLKTIRGLDDTFRKKGDKYFSRLYEVKICEFNYVG